MIYGRTDLVYLRFVHRNKRDFLVFIQKANLRVCEYVCTSIYEHVRTSAPVCVSTQPCVRTRIFSFHDRPLSINRVCHQSTCVCVCIWVCEHVSVMWVRWPLRPLISAGRKPADEPSHPCNSETPIQLQFAKYHECHESIKRLRSI